MRALLWFALAILCVSANSKQPVPTPTETIQQPKADSTKNQTNSSAHEQGSDNSPATIRIAPSLTTEPKPNKASDDHRDYTSAEWWLVYITGALVFVTTGLMIYTAKLWGATNALAGDARKTADKQTTDMKESLRISGEAAEAAKLQAKTSADTLQRAYRPWLGLLDEIMAAGPLIFDDTSAHVKITKFTTKNVGNSPAMAASRMLNLIVGPRDIDPRRAISEINEAVVRSGFGMPILQNEFRCWPDCEARMDRTQFQHWVGGDVNVFLSGFVGYLDQFREPHASTFLFQYTTHDGKGSFPPKGEIVGSFKSIGVGWKNT